MIINPPIFCNTSDFSNILSEFFEKQSHLSKIHSIVKKSDSAKESLFSVYPKYQPSASFAKSIPTTKIIIVVSALEKSRIACKRNCRESRRERIWFAQNDFFVHTSILPPVWWENYKPETPFCQEKYDATKFSCPRVVKKAPFDNQIKGCFKRYSQKTDFNITATTRRR